MSQHEIQELVQGALSDARFANQSPSMKRDGGPSESPERTKEVFVDLVIGIG